LFGKAFPEWDFKYFSNESALALSLKIDTILDTIYESGIFNPPMNFQVQSNTSGNYDELCIAIFNFGASLNLRTDMLVAVDQV
jgi:hypothetical protein